MQPRARALIFRKSQDVDMCVSSLSVLCPHLLEHGLALGVSLTLAGECPEAPVRVCHGRPPPALCPWPWRAGECQAQQADG